MRERLAAALRSTAFWVCTGALGLFLAVLFMIGTQGGGSLFTTVLAFASLYALVGLGQMLVVTSGPGNIDLSIPPVMVLAGYLAMGQMQGSGGIAFGIAAALVTGVAAGAVNGALVLAIRIPPMIATLASGFIIQSVATAYSRGSTAAPIPPFADLVTSRPLGLPMLTWLVGLVGLLLLLEFRFGAFGRRVEAIGQNSRAARLASLPVDRTVFLAYVLSGGLAGCTGLLYAAYSGGASLGMAGEFMLISIAVVVLGGTNVAGGQASVIGVFGAAALLYLINVLLNTLHLGPGVKLILTGAILIGVLAVASPRGNQ